MTQLRTLGVLVSAASILPFLVSCNDPEGKALGIFTQQGITLLKPVRTYVVPGGLVVLAKNAQALYLDPLDNPDPGGNSVDSQNEI